jgi:2-methylcitrate dehydratase PrpD
VTSAGRASVLARLAGFAVEVAPPPAARHAAAAAVLDTVGVTLAGAKEPVARIVHALVAAEGSGPCLILGTAARAGAAAAAFANGTAAHALDYDDMCFVSLAHPSAPLVPAVLALGEHTGASGSAALDAYIVGFEIEGRLGRAMNPRHYERGWHCTSTLGVIGAAAAAARLLGLDAATAARALAIAASLAGGLKDNFGTMVKPLHAGMAARQGIVAAQLAKAGITASESALDGPQGFLHAMDGEVGSLSDLASDLGARWEILDTGITVKLYPSCAGTHPALDAVLDLHRAHGFGADDVEAVDVGVDAVTPTILIYSSPASDLQAKFSMPFCVAAAIVFGRVALETFDTPARDDARVRALMPRVTLRVDTDLDAGAPPLTQASVQVRLRDGRILTQRANGARGYPSRPASPDALLDKFRSCAARALSPGAVTAALAAVQAFDAADDVRAVTAKLVGASQRRTDTPDDSP